MALFTLWRLECSLHKPGDVEPIHKSEDEWWVPGTDPVIGFTPGTGFPERVLKQPGVGVPRPVLKGARVCVLSSPAKG